MAKKTAKLPLEPKLYACCSNADCKRLQATVDFLKVWGLDHNLKKDGQGAYFDVAVPAHWGERRSDTFAKGLAKQPTSH